MQITKVQAAIAAFGFMVLGGLMTKQPEVAVQQPVSQVQPEIAQVQPVVVQEQPKPNPTYAKVNKPFVLVNTGRGIVPLLSETEVRDYLESSVENASKIVAGVPVDPASDVSVKLIWACQAEYNVDADHVQLHQVNSGYCMTVDANIGNVRTAIEDARVLLSDPEK